MGATHRLKVVVRRAASPIARAITRRSARILMYHRFGPGDPGRKVTTDALDLQLSMLRRRFNVVPLRELVGCLLSGRPFPPNAVAVTVDDAYADFGTYAYPLFKKHRVPVTLYVVSEFAAGRLWLWWDALRYMLDACRPGRRSLTIRNKVITFASDDGASKHQAWLELAAIGNSLGPDDRADYLLEAQDALSVTLPDAPPPAFAALSWDQLRAFDPAIVEIGAHTRTHPILALCTPDRIVREVAGSKADIEAQIGRPVTSFCYPNGQWSDVDERCIRAVQDAGFDNAVLACGQLVHRGSNRFALERLAPSFDFSEFESDLSGVAYLRQLRTAGQVSRA
jgi:peptidoglycan/xylan/chitin deacetylase (PgdA/CDA1 family)